MNRKLSGNLSNKAFVLAAVLNLTGVAHADEAKTAYPRMAPIDQYLMTDQKAEIALARSAAPASISGEATVVVLRQHGYETAVKGKNGFVCSRAILDVTVRLAGILEFQNAGSDLLQPGRRTVGIAIYL